ncbi:major facilitator superfamily domain-containing protein 9-like isoform X2 [Leptinotarsa decemlineata]|uniref:major facilitator superfamily domain-containing protein 9-like isoform X2 n=1 Tax=Leptinotarsa decemlineata TaxID=7539 RepID=UPI003D305824
MKILYIFFILDMINGSILMTLFTKHVLSLGGSNLHLGMIGSSTAFLGLILKSVSGRLSDTRGTTKVLPWCFLISAAGNIVSAFSPSLYVLFAGRLLCTFGMPVQALLNTMLTNLKKEAQSAFVNTLGIYMALAVITGSLLGGFISEFGNGITYTYLLMSLNLLISFGLVGQLPNKRRLNKKDERKHTGSALANIKTTITTLKNVIISERYWDVFAIKACLEAMYGMINVNLIYLMSFVFGMGGRQIGFVISFLCVCGIVTNILQMKVNAIFYSDDKGYSKLIHGSSLLILGYLGINFSSSFTLFIIFFVVCSISKSLLDPAIMKLLLFKVDENEKGTVMGSFDSIRSLIELSNPIISGTIVEAFGPKAVYPVCICLTTVIISISVMRKYQV